MKNLNRNLLASVSLSFSLMAGAHASNADADADAAKQVSVAAQQDLEENWEEVASTPVAEVARVEETTPAKVYEPQTWYGSVLSKVVGKGVVCWVGEKVQGRDYTPKKDATYEEKLASVKLLVEAFDGKFEELAVAEHKSLVVAYEEGVFGKYYMALMEAKNGGMTMAEKLKGQTDNRREAREARQSSSSDDVNE